MLGFVFRGDADGKVHKEDTEIPDSIGEDKLLIQITHSGLCGTDLHYRSAGIALGHEGIGIIQSIGNYAHGKFSIGERVGWGYKHGGCGTLRCTKCLEGNDTMCERRELFGTENTHQGSLGSHVILSADHVFKIPALYSSEIAAPLMCAGPAVFGAVWNADIKCTHRVGVLGMGGLGHLAVQFLRKMGCDVVVITRTLDKSDDAFEFGANSVTCLEELSQGKLEPLDFLIITASEVKNWDALVSALKRKGKIVIMTVGFNKLSCSFLPLIMNDQSIQGSMEAPRHVIEKMLAFGARNAIRTQVEVLEMTAANINVALDRLQKGEVRYRFVFQSQK